ncbi:MAG: hypothetical protein GEV08_22875 [Acidimicrobiia bacterium]|nr:hypothetical protein [Acidimicrobiia bacterium]
MSQLSTRGPRTPSTSGATTPGRPSPRPRPAAAHDVSPDEVVAEVRRLLGAGATRSRAAAALVEGGTGRGALGAAHTAWVQAMHRLPTDDVDAAGVLRVIEAALALLPRPPSRYWPRRRG